jgi:Flp pilus assembly protein TadG
MINRARISKRRGAALVEAAIVLPVIIMLIGIAADYSRIIYSSVTISGSARNGALYEFDPMNSLESNYTSYANCGSADATNLNNNLAMSESTAAVGTETDVTVTANTKFSTISSWLLLPKLTSVNRSIVVRKAQITPDPYVPGN